MFELVAGAKQITFPVREDPCPVRGAWSRANSAEKQSCFPRNRESLCLTLRPVFFIAENHNSNSSWLSSFWTGTHTSAIHGLQCGTCWPSESFQPVPHAIIHVIYTSVYIICKIHRFHILLILVLWRAPTNPGRPTPYSETSQHAKL